MVILHIAPLSNNKSSGLTYAIPPLVHYQNKILNIKTALLNTSSKENYLIYDYDFPTYKYGKSKSERNISKLPFPFNRPDLVVFHSTYIPSHIKIAIQLRKIRIPYVIMPHGGMTVGAQQVKKVKKRLANLLCFNKFVENSLALQCLSEGEFKETKMWNKKMLIVGNGMKLPKEFKNKKEDKDAPIRFTFIGRLNIYIKGLDLLLGGIAKSADNIRNGNGVFDIYGPYNSDSKRFIEKFISDYSIEDIVKLHEPVYDNDKDDVLKRTDVFVLTSRFEGHPMGVLEAMSYGIPCLLTHGTNMSSEVLHEDAGWEVQPSEDSIAKGINNILINDKENIRKKGLNARGLIINNYSWDKIATQSINEYKNLLNI